MTTAAFATGSMPSAMDGAVVYEGIFPAMQPYLDALARVNDKYLLQIVVPDDSMQDIYECIGDSTPAQFEALLDQLCAAGTIDGGEIHLIYVLLGPYQAVVDLLNAELGTTLMITDGAKYDVYKAYRGMTPNQVEARLRTQLNAGG
ncbi:MAG: hypothetical protein GX558_01400 [Clostridiales bacterium]|nr:hypothetical protein [Clostridiales bacterium]